MTRRVNDKREDLMIGLNTWLFGVGAVLVAADLISKIKYLEEFSVSAITAFGFDQLMHLSTFAILMAGCFYSLIIIRPDLARRKREKKILQLEKDAAAQQSYIDAFTGLYNHVYFEKTLQTYLEEMKATNAGLGLVYVEIKNLINFADVNGTNLEDKILEEIGNNLTRTAREYDVIARVGVCKFAILTPQIEEGDLVAIMRRFTTIIGNTKLDVEHMPLDFTVGSSFYQRQSAENFMNAADTHLHRIGRGSGNPNQLAAVS